MEAERGAFGDCEGDPCINHKTVEHHNGPCGDECGVGSNRDVAHTDDILPIGFEQYTARHTVRQRKKKGVRNQDRRIGIMGIDCHFDETEDAVLMKNLYVIELRIILSVEIDAEAAASITAQTD